MISYLIVALVWILLKFSLTMLHPSEFEPENTEWLRKYKQKTIIVKSRLLILWNELLMVFIWYHVLELNTIYLLHNIIIDENNKNILPDDNHHHFYHKKSKFIEYHSNDLFLFITMLWQFTISLPWFPWNYIRKLFCLNLSVNTMSWRIEGWTIIVCIVILLFHDLWVSAMVQFLYLSWLLWLHSNNYWALWKSLNLLGFNPMSPEQYSKFMIGNPSILDRRTTSFNLGNHIPTQSMLINNSPSVSIPSLLQRLHKEKKKVKPPSFFFCFKCFFCQIYTSLKHLLFISTINSIH